MTLSQDTLADELAMSLATLIRATPPPPDAAETLAHAFGDYFKDATFNSVAVLATAVDTLAVPALIAGMVFPDPATNPTPAQGAQAFVDGYTAFWGALVAAPASFWPAATVIVPPTGLAGLSAALQTQFAANNDPAVTLAQAAANLATAIHPNAGLTGTGMIGVLGPYPIL